MTTTKNIAAGLAAIVGLGAMTLSGVALKPALAQAQAFPGQFQRPLNAKNGNERHPDLRRALANLERTETNLRRANRDFGGHREKAADLCHQAEQEIQLALQDDKH